MKPLLSSSSVAACLSILLLAACGASPTAAPVATLPTDTPTVAASATPTITPTPVPTATPTPTATPLPTFTLSGVVFFDYNGNGLQDEAEPPIEGVEINLRRHRGDPEGEMIELSVVTNGDGEYAFPDLPAGDYLLDAKSPNEDDPAQAFRYVSLSPREFQLVDQLLQTAIDRHTQRDIGLMQGFLTLPFGESTVADVWSYFDRDPGLGIRRFDGRTDYEARVANNHFAIDYRMPVGTPIVASAPGEVTIAGTYPEGEASCPGVIMVQIKVEIEGNYWLVQHGHLQSTAVAPGDLVQRGQVIGYSGESGSCSVGRPHLDLLVFNYSLGREVDPYRDLSDAGAVSLWTVDNAPQYFP